MKEGKNGLTIDFNDMKKRKNFALTLGEKHKMVSVMKSCTTGKQVDKCYLWYVRVIGQRLRRERELNGDHSPVLDDLDAFKERMYSIYRDKFGELALK